MYYIDVYENEKIFMQKDTYKYTGYIITCIFGFIVANIICYVFV
jgi:hypothetical protein